MLKASLSSFFTNLDDKLAVVNDRVELCEMCIRVTKYAYLLTNHPSTNKASEFESAVGSHACSSYHEHREDDCVTLSHSIINQPDFANAQFTPSELNLSVEDLRTLVVSKADQRCAELSCCGSKIFRRQNHPTTNGQLQQEDIDAEANALSKQEMELVNQRSLILKQKLALDDHIANLRRDAGLLERTKNSVRTKRQKLTDLERRLKHREERLSEKEQDLAERQRLTPYYLPYPLPSSAPPAAPAAAPPAPAASTTPTTDASSQPAPASLVSRRLVRRESSDIDSLDYNDDDITNDELNSDPLQELNEEEENNFVSLLQRMRAHRHASTQPTDLDE